MNPGRRIFPLIRALSLLVLLALVSEPINAAPQDYSRSTASAKAVADGGLKPLPSDRRNSAVEKAHTLMSRGNYSQAMLVLQANIERYGDPRTKKPLIMHVSDWRFDPTSQNLVLRELTNEQLIRIHLSDIYNLRGVVFTSMNQIHSAADSFCKSLEFNPINGQALSNLSEVYVRLGRLDDAMALAKKALQISDRFLDARESLAAIYRARNQFDLERKELETLNSCLQLKSKDYLYLINLGRCKFMYSVISQKAPSAKKLVAMGAIHRQFKNAVDSEKCHLAAIKLDNKLVEAHWSYGLLLLEQKRFAEAIKEFRCAIALDPSYAMPYFHIGEAYKATKRYKDAIACYSKYLSMDNRSSAVLIDVYFNMGICHGHLQEYAAGVKDLTKTLTFDLDSSLKAEVLSSRGTLHQALGNKTQALKDYEAAMELAPSNKLISGKRGKLMLSLGEYEQATVDLSNYSKTEVAEVSKEPPSAADLKAQIAHYDKLIKIFPRTAIDSLYNRGLLYLTMGDAARAAADMQSVVALSKDCNATADSAACYGSIALRMLRKLAEADRLLQAYDRKIRSGSSSQSVPVVVDYFMHRPALVPMNRLLNGDLKHNTRVMTLIGLDSYSRNDKNSARKYLSLVRNSGDPSMDEFALAVSYLKRLGQN